MITTRRSDERGHVDRGWLIAHHSFSFANYYDPRFMGFGPLRVINDDRFGPSRGFGTHPHDNMEIVTYVLEGQLAHTDTTGRRGSLGPGDVQRMSAGSGVAHSEFNGSPSEWLHLLQIWIEPDVTDATPRYDEKHFDRASKKGRLQAIVSRDGRDGSLPIHQSAELYATVLEEGDAVTHTLEPGRQAYVYVVDGSVTVNGEALTTGDAAMLTDETQVALAGAGEVLLFDLP